MPTAANTILKIMKPMKNDDYVAFLTRTLGEWHLDYPAREGLTPVGHDGCDYKAVED